jgi:hypothetical protein
MFDSPSVNPNVTGWLRYNSQANLPEPQLVAAYPEFDDTALEPLQPEPVVPYDTLIPLIVNFTNIDGINYAVVNNNTYSPPTVPAIFTALTTGLNATNPAVYGQLTNSHVLNHLDMVWLVINNDDSGGHPCIPLLLNADTSSSPRPLISSPPSQRRERRTLRSFENATDPSESCPSRRSSSQGRWIRYTCFSRR